MVTIGRITLEAASFEGCGIQIREGLVVSARHRISVLIVDDNPDHRVLIERRLRGAGIETRLAGTGEEALERLDGIDLVLLDYRLPGMSGLQALAAMQDAGPSVVMVTGKGSEDLAVEAMRAGAIDYVVKDPHYVEALPEVVERAWRHHDLTRRAAELQRLALLVNSADDREAIFSEIVRGAGSLLAASSCVLCIAGDEGLEVAAHTGRPIEDLDKLLSQAEEALKEGGHLSQAAGDELFVALSRNDDDPVGVLAVLAEQPHEYVLEEITLAETFASFAALALRNFRRLELERSLVAELRRANEERRTFVDSVSHDLRTPLACIMGFSATLLQHWDRLDERTSRSYVERIRKHTQDLANLIRQTLDFGESERGRLVAYKQPVSLGEEVNSAVELLEPLLDGRPVEVAVPDIEVLVDRELLQRIFWNLFSNAVKYSSGGTPIAIRAASRDEWASVEVIDEGIGLTPEEAERVFEPFWRAPRTIKSGSRGVGIGLSLCKQYVESMGGRIWVSSRPDRGSTFHFTLPLSEGGDEATT